jgi:hypothetical protein
MNTVVYQGNNNLQDASVEYNTLVLNSDVICIVGPFPTNTTLVVTCSFAAPGVLSVILTTPDGLVLQPMQLNSGNALNADSMYSFSHTLSSGEIASYKYSTSCEATIFKVENSTSQIISESGTQGILSGNTLSTFIDAILVVMLVSMITKMMMNSVSKKVV